MKTIHIRTPDDELATKVTCLLEALGYDVRRDMHEASTAPYMVHWATMRIARRFSLSDIETEVLVHVLRGRLPEEIGKALGLSKETIKWHVYTIRTKTGSRGREGLVRLALFGGVHPPAIEPAETSGGARPRQPWL